MNQSSLVEMELDYEELVRSYNENLHVNLRNFKMGPDFLDTWVPDEDHTKSVFGIFEAAEGSNLERLSILLSDSVAKTINRSWILQMSSSIGDLSFETTSKGVLAVFKFAKGGALQIHPLYRAALERCSSRISQEGEIRSVATYQTELSASLAGATLTCVVNEKHEIVAAKHRGATGTTRILLDQFCAEIQGKPIQEASEHGVVRLEYKLRDKNHSQHVNGIVLPENADPAFKMPLALIRQIYRDYVTATNYKMARNFYVMPVGAVFSSLSKEDKIRKIQDALVPACHELGLQSKDVEVVDLKPDARAVLNFRQDSNKPSFGKGMIKLERLLMERIDPRIELVLESVEDRNRRKGRGEKILALEDAKKLGISPSAPK